MPYAIRPVQPQDSPHLFKLIVSTLTEFGCVGPGFACNDPELSDLYTFYQQPGARYWVIVDEKENLCGGGGYALLKGTVDAEAVCELQKLYFRPELRGLGFGKKLISLALEYAAQDGYQTIYLETIGAMAGAVHLYKKLGFEDIPHALGDTGHHRCTVFMQRPLAVAEPLEASPRETVHADRPPVIQ